MLANKYSRKTIAMILAVVMVFSCFGGLTAFAEGSTSDIQILKDGNAALYVDPTNNAGEDAQINADGTVITAAALAEGQNTVEAALGSDTAQPVIWVDKTIAGTDMENVFDITLKVQTLQNVQEQVVPVDAAVVLVFDTSSSMDFCADCGKSKDDAIHQGGRTTLYNACPDNSGNTWVSNGKSGKNQKCVNCGEKANKHTEKTITTPATCVWESNRLTVAQAAAKAFATSFVENSNGASRYIAIAEFYKDAYKVLDWTDVSTDRGMADFTSAVNGLSNGLSSQGGTNVQGGLTWAQTLLASNTISDMEASVVLLSDGAPNTINNGAAVGSKINGRYYRYDPANENWTTNVSLANWQNDSRFKSTLQPQYGDPSKYAAYEASLVAAAIKNSGTDLYTLCFGASGDLIYDSAYSTTGQNVGAWLKGVSSTTATETFDFTADNATQLNEKFNNIIEKINLRLAAKAWLVTDPMSEYIVFDQTANTSFSTTDANAVRYFDTAAKKIVWDLRADDTVSFDKKANKYSYQLTYRVALNTEAPGFAFLDGSNQAVYYPTNGQTTLKYLLTEEADGEVTIIDEDTVDFNVPAVKGLVGAFDVKKVASYDNTQLLANAQFKLSGKTLSGSDWSAERTTGSGAEGTNTQLGIASFAGIPAGVYTLEEIAAPAGYTENADKYTVTVSFGEATIKAAGSEDRAVAAGAGKDAIVIANDVDPKNIDIPVEKAWADTPDKLKQAVTLQLLQSTDGAEATVYGSIELDGTVDAKETTAWKYTFEDCPTAGVVDKEIVSYSYSVKEVIAEGSALEKNFTTGYNGNQSSGFTVTNSFTDPKTSFNVSKQWVDPADSYHAEKSVKVYLTKDGEPQSQYVTLNAENDFADSFAGLEIFDEYGNIIEYGVAEEAVSGYTQIEGSPAGSMAEGFVITNKINQEYYTISGTKAWADYNDHYNTRPDSVTIGLFLDGATEASYTTTATEANDWNFAFEANTVKKYADNGKSLLEYTVKEIACESINSSYSYNAPAEAAVTFDQESGRYTVTNTLETVTEDVDIEKVWKAPDDVELPADLDVTLTNTTTDRKVGELTLSGSGDTWNGSFENVELYNKEEGTAYSFSADEEALADYSKDISGNAAEGFKIVNTYKAEDTVSVAVTKTWKDPADTEHPDAVFQLYADGEKVTGKTLTLEDGTLAGSFTGLTKYKTITVDGDEIMDEDADGNPVGTGEYEQVEKFVTIVYTVEELSVEGYHQTNVKWNEDTDKGDNFAYSFENTIDQAKVKVAVSKTWVNPSNEEEPNVTFTLTRAGDETFAQSLVLEAPATSLSFEDLDKYNLSTGDKWVYSVSESVTGYSNTFKSGDTDASDDFAFSFTNQLNQAYAELGGTKYWIDPAGTAHGAVTIELLQDGTKVDEVILTADNTTASEAYSFGQWPVYKEDMSAAHVYTVRETAVPEDYSATYYDGMNLNVTNKLAQDYTAITVNKGWVKPADMAAPEVEFTLYADKAEVAKATLASGKDSVSFVNADREDGLWPIYNDARQKIDYTTQEVKLSDYTSDKTSEFSYTNTIGQKYISVPVEKKWEGPAAAPKSEITVYLIGDDGQRQMKDGEPVTLLLNANNDWSGSFQNLEKFDLATGQYLKYSVEEVAVDDYSSAIEGDYVNGFTITNTYDTFQYQIIRTYTTYLDGTAQEPQVVTGDIQIGVKGQVVTEDGGQDAYLTGPDSNTYIYMPLKGNDSVSLENPTPELYQVKLFYERTVTTPEPPTPDDPEEPEQPDPIIPDDDDDDRPTRRPSETVIEDPEVPMGDLPVELPDPEVPLGDAPEEVILIEEEVPLGDVPQTGDNNLPIGWMMVALASAAGLAGLAITSRRRKEEE